MAKLLVGFFFNDGSSTGPADRTGNVAAGFIKRLDSKAGNQFVPFLAHCPDAACTFATTLTFQILASTWSTGAPDTLRLQWTPGTGQFVFTLNPGAPAEERAMLSTDLSVAGPAVLDFKALRIENRVANCTAGRRQASMNALFGNVMLNPEAVP